MSCSSSSRSSANVFETGKYETKLQTVDPSSSSSSSSSSCAKTTSYEAPPKPLLIASPCEGGEYPVVMLLHGYLLYNSFYSQLILHIASHGFIVIAPQLYTIAGPDTIDEIKSTAATANWLSIALSRFLPPHVTPNLTKLALSGHSRGGKTAFALALRKTEAATDLKFSALIGIDPVDGMAKGKQTPPPVLTYRPESFDLNGTPVMIVGSGLGERRRNPVFPPCAPKGVNHEEFFRECRKPAWYFVVKDYGHLDMLDDETRGVRGRVSYCLCKNGESRKPMRSFVGGSVVAFLKAFLEGDDVELNKIKDGYDGDLPVELERIEFRL